MMGNIMDDQGQGNSFGKVIGFFLAAIGGSLVITLASTGVERCGQ
jgi:hypothetical protein